MARRRPTSLAGAVKAFAAGVAILVVFVLGAISMAVIVPWVYGEYGFHPEENARSWAALTPQYSTIGFRQGPRMHGLRILHATHGMVRLQLGQPHGSLPPVAFPRNNQARALPSGWV